MAGATVRYLLPYSPDFNPIEKAFFKLKAHPRKAAERIRDALWDRIGTLIDQCLISRMRKISSPQQGMNQIERKML